MITKKLEYSSSVQKDIDNLNLSKGAVICMDADKVTYQYPYPEYGTLYITELKKRGFTVVLVKLNKREKKLPHGSIERAAACMNAAKRGDIVKVL